MAYAGQFDPVLRRGQWTDTIEVISADDGSAVDLSSASVSLKVYDPEDDEAPLLTATTDDGSLTATSGGLATFAFTASQIAVLDPGSYEVSLVVTLDDETEEILRSTILVQ